MSFLRRLRLPPARTVWKSFTSKLQRKLHKLQSSKAIIKKPPKRLKKPTAGGGGGGGGGSWSSAFIERRRKKRRLVLSHHASHLHHPRHVYVDKLFKEPVNDHEVAEPARAKNIVKLLDQQPAAAVPGASKEGGSGAEKACSDHDDIWESLGLASPQMRGIDERAEAFIARFRAEMEVQENLARNL